MTVFKELDQQTSLENWRPLLVGGKALHELSLASHTLRREEGLGLAVLRPPVHKTFGNRRFCSSHAVEDVHGLVETTKKTTTKNRLVFD